MNTTVPSIPDIIDRVALPARWINDIGSPRTRIAEQRLIDLGWKFDSETGERWSSDSSTYSAAETILFEFAPWLKGK